MLLFLHRNAQRIIHIPFFPPDRSLSQSDKLRLERKLRSKTQNASSCIGHIIKLGRKVRSGTNMMGRVMPYVTTLLEGLPYRIIKSYALMLSVAREVILTIDNYNMLLYVAIHSAVSDNQSSALHMLQVLL
jgi:hypothetical protein